jgi:hypothetical protein
MQMTLVEAEATSSELIVQLSGLSVSARGWAALMVAPAVALVLLAIAWRIVQRRAQKEAPVKRKRKLRAPAERSARYEQL